MKVSEGGWRWCRVDDDVIIDNKPAVEEAKKEGEVKPQISYIVVPFAVIQEVVQEGDR